jgi:hypothetical protein
MTTPDTTEPTRTPEPVAAEPDTAAPAADDTADSGKEAAKYRRRLRETEAERDTLTERLTTLQRSEAERLAAAALTDGADLWREGTELADLLDDDGNIDPDKVTAAATSVSHAHPHWRKREPAAPPASTVTSNGKIGPGPGPEPRSWTDVLQRKLGVE